MKDDSKFISIEQGSANWDKSAWVVILLCAPLAPFGLAIAFYIFGDSPPPDSVLVGTVKCVNETKFPTAEPGCFGHVEIADANRFKKNPHLVDWAIGTPEIELKVGSEVKKVTLPERDRKGWRFCKPTRSEVKTLPASIANRVDRKLSTYRLSEWVIRDSDRIVVSTNTDGSGARLWCGAEPEIRARGRYERNLGTGVFAGLGAIALFISLLVLVVQRRK